MDTLTRFHKEKIHRPNRMIKNREVGSLFKNLAANTEDAMIESINKMLCKMYFFLFIPKRYQITKNIASRTCKFIIKTI